MSHQNEVLPIMPLLHTHNANVHQYLKSGGGEGGQSTLNLEVVICEVGREGRGGEGGGVKGGQSTLNLEVVICEVGREGRGGEGRRWGRRGGEGGSINTEFVEHKNKYTISKKCIS